MNQNEVSFKFKNSITGEKKLEKYAETLLKIKSISKGINKASIKEISDGATNVAKFNKETSKTESLVSKAFQIGSVTAFVNVLKTAVKTIGSLTAKSAEYTENLNLYGVAFDGATESADKFVNKLTEMYGLDESWLVRTTGIFKQLSNAMALSTEQGTKLATLMTQMSVDISSLYNIDIERASSVLQSSLAGQTKPIRGATGADITQATLQTTLDSLGIDKYIGDLSYAEKRLVIIISLTQQLKEATNDFGKTIESPANQMRILDEQWQRLSRSVGNLFLPILARVLPYLNATLMVLTEIINMVASIFGFNIEEYDYGISGVADSVLDLEEGLSGATESASKLKKEMSGLRSFDKLNVIKTPTSAKASGGAGGAGGISPDLMKAFNIAFDEYNNKLKDVRMKANDIRDSVMEWLGFTRELNYETGEWEWIYGGTEKTIKNIWRTFKQLSPQAKIVVGYFGYLFGASLLKNAQRLVDLLGKTKMGKAINSLLSPAKQLTTYLGENFASGLKGLKSLSFKEVIDTWSGTLTTLDKVKTSLVGAGGVIAGFALTKDAMKKVTEEGWNLSRGLEAGAGALAQLVGGGLAGASVGGLTGGVIGLIIGGASLAISSIDGITSALTPTQLAFKATNERVKEMYNTWIDSEKNRKKILFENNSEVDYYQTILAELQNIVDENGRIKLGYEDRVNFITSQLASALGVEISIVDGQIQKYDELANAVQKAIDKKTAMAYLSSLEESYNEAIKNRTTAEQEYANTIENSQQALNDYMKRIDEIGKKYHLTEEAIEDVKNGTAEWHDVLEWSDAVVVKKKLENYKKAVNDTQEAQEQAKIVLEGYTDSIYLYGKAYQYVEEENYKALNEFMEYEAQIYGKSEKETQKYYENKLKANTTSLENLKQNRKNYNKEEYDELVSYYEGLINLTSNKLDLLKMTSITKVEDLTDDMVTKWGEMSKKSQEEFSLHLNKLPENIQTEIVDKMQAKGYSISEELQKGINQIKPKVKVEADTKSLGDKLKSLFSGKDSLFAKLGINLPKINWKSFGFAEGGLPPVGQLFIANERGPELVGHIGGQSFVANQNQMMDLLDQKISGSSSGVKNATFQIYVGSKKIAEQVLNDLGDMAKSNGKPITING